MAVLADSGFDLHVDADLSPECGSERPVLAIDPGQATNAQRVADLARLGYLPEPVLDPTFGIGGMWAEYQPDLLYRFDIDESRGDFTADCRDMPFSDNTIGSVLLDVPYKLGGTPSSPEMDRRYGTTSYVPAVDVKHLLSDGIRESARVVRPGGFVIVKCQNQVNAGRKRWQTIDVVLLGESVGLEHVDELHLLGGRPQPAGRRQVHSRSNYSTFVVMRVS